MSLGQPTQITICQTGAVSTTHVAALTFVRRWPSNSTVDGGALLFRPIG